MDEVYRQLVHSFSEADLSFLIGLHGLAAKWKTIGVHLGVPPDRLDVIQRDYRHMCDDCLREMFLWWLRNGKDITAKKLAKAVHEVGNHQAEIEINRKFGMCMYKPYTAPQ